MANIFWTGELSPLTKFLVNCNCLFAWIKRNMEDDSAMKQRIRSGYNGKFTDHVINYEKEGLGHYTRAAKALLEKINVQERTILDIGCGSGIISFLLLEKSANRVFAGDFSERMLSCAKAKNIEQNDPGNKIKFLSFDAESLPFGNENFDIAVSGLVMGVVPNPLKMINEMARVVKKNGIVAISTHGAKHYYEACELAFRSINIPSILGYRIEFWPQKESVVRSLFLKAGLADVVTRSVIYQENFASGEQAYDFFAATSSAWWYGKIPPHRRDKESIKIRNFFKQKGINKITSEVVLAYGRKP